jgi:hypothetical protein
MRQKMHVFSRFVYVPRKDLLLPAEINPGEKNDGALSSFLDWMS